MALIPRPDLELRNEELLAAQAIARVTGALTVVDIDRQIETLRSLRAIVASGGLAPAICPELTNANPSSPHTVLLEAQAWLVGQLARRLNQVPDSNLIEFARLFGIELREASAAQTLLRFTVNAPLGTDVTIPSGVEVQTPGGEYVFATVASLTIPSGASSGEVEAVRNVPGKTLLAPDTLTDEVDTIGFVTGVTNPKAVDSGAEAETVSAALARARNYQKRGERLVTAQDLEDAVREEVLGGVGLARAFQFARDGDFTGIQPGHTTLVVAGANGLPLEDEVKAEIRLLLKQLVGNQYVYVDDPYNITFSIEASVRLSAMATASAALNEAEKRLRAFYAIEYGNFGKPILRSDIIAIVESTPGVDRLVSPVAGPILTAPMTDSILRAHQTPALLAVTLHVIQ
jgi:uncharacterized phage protein gp47/JayE